MSTLAIPLAQSGRGGQDVTLSSHTTGALGDITNLKSSNATMCTRRTAAMDKIGPVSGTEGAAIRSKSGAGASSSSDVDNTTVSCASQS